MNKIKWYHTRNMSGQYLSPCGWYKYCQKWGWNHLWYVITWYFFFRGKMTYPRNKFWRTMGKIFKIKNKRD